MNMMHVAEIAWVAGVFEGEGTFGISTVTRNNGKECPKKYHQVYLALHMTDEDVIDRLRSLTGVGVTYALKTPPEKQKQAWMWKVGVRNDVEDLIWAMLPYLGKRRSARAHEALAVIAELNQKAAARKVSA